MNTFASGLSEGPDSEAMRHAMDVKRSDEIGANCLFWFEFDLKQYTSATVDIEDLGKSKEKLILVAGGDSGDGPGVGLLKVLGGVLRK